MAQTLKELASDKKYLGAEIGLTAVLHTWGQNLSVHPLYRLFFRRLFFLILGVRKAPLCGRGA